MAAPGVPPAVDRVVEMCLKPSPEERYADAQALKDALQQALAADLAGPNAQAAAAIAMPAGQRRIRRACRGAEAADADGQHADAAAAPAAASRPAPTPPPRPLQPQRHAAAGRPAPPPQPRRRRRRPSLEQAAVPKSFNVDAALSAVDDTHERWLIQKDKLDFGPFIDAAKCARRSSSGKILGEHVIIDTENGAAPAASRTTRSCASS